MKENRKQTIELLKNSDDIYLVITPEGAAVSVYCEEMIYVLLTSFFEDLRKNYGNEVVEKNIKKALEMSSKSKEELEKEVLKKTKFLLDMLKNNMED